MNALAQIPKITTDVHRPTPCFVFRRSPRYIRTSDDGALSAANLGQLYIRLYLNTLPVLFLRIDVSLRLSTIKQISTFLRHISITHCIWRLEPSQIVLITSSLDMNFSETVILDMAVIRARIDKIEMDDAEVEWR